MSSRAGRSFDPRKAALALAVAVAAISAGVVLYFVAAGSSSPESTVAAAPPSIGEVPPDAPAPSSAGPGIGETGWARLQFVDKKDPTRIASEMEWQSLSPDEAQRGRSHISEPRFWIYPEDGRTVHVQAREATVFQPDQQSEPESGRLYGGSLIRVFSAGPGGQRRAIDLEQDKPELLIATETITFDSALGEIGMPSACEILTPQLTKKVAHLRLNVNELQRRLELLEAGPGEMRYLVSRDDPRTERAPQNEEAPASAAPAQASGEQPPAAPREDLYRATFTGRVMVRQATREVTGDALDVWARLIDGSLPPGAFPEPAGPADEPAAPAPLPAGDTPAIAQADAGTTAADEPEPSGDVVLTWTGTLVVRPLAATPPELENANHVALRFTADTTGNVAFADTDAGIAGACVWAGLAVTTQDLTLSGPGPAAVRVTTRGGQEITVPRLDLNLLSGIGLIRGSGVMNDGDRLLNWAEQCDLVFATRNGMMTGALREATFRGGVTARDGRSDLGGDLLRATFIPAPGAADGSDKVALAGVLIEGGASGTGDEGSIFADRIDVAFDAPAEGDPQPKIITATGNVRASNKDAELRTQFAEATLAADDAGELIVTDFRAEGAVRLASDDRGIAAGADVLRYDGLREAARLTATGDEPAWVSHERSRIASATIDLDAAAERLIVPGPGVFEHDPAPGGGGAGAAGPLGDSRITAAWTESLTADNAKGIIECFGEVVVSTDPASPQVYRATAPYLRLDIEPAAERAPAESAQPRKDRRLLRAMLESSDEAAPALVESRTYAAAGADGERRLEQFLRLTGARIIADDQAGTGGVISVPGPGRAAVYDGRSVAPALAADAAKPAAPAPPAAPFADREFRGSALFTWNGSMDLDRSTELLTMRRGVRLVHRPLTDEPPTTLECERLRAELLFKSGPGGGSSASADLVRADATGAVYVESAVRRLMADGVMFDASRRLVEATAADGNRVTMYDDDRATVTSAARLRWDLAADRIDIERPSPVIAPVTPR